MEEVNKTINAQSELIREIGSKKVKCVYIKKVVLPRRNFEDITLKVGWVEEDMEEFMKKMDFEYKNGFGSQYVYGFIWYRDGTWSERKEYDGSEWWEYMECPEIPENLK